MKSRIRTIIACLVLLLASEDIRGTAMGKMPRAECVILLHGLGRTAWSMKRLEWSLSRAGYSVVNVSYPSRSFTVERLADEHLRRILAGQVPGEFTRVHFVTHSLGGIVLRQYLETHELRNLGRVVMLAPPNQGSELADSLGRNALGRWVLGPGGCQLGTSADALPKQLGSASFELGVIAGDRSLNPRFSRKLPGADDGKVSVESARMSGSADFLVVHSSHTWMMWRAETIRQVLAFLRDGKFGHER